MAKHIKVTLINGETRNFTFGDEVDYEEIVDKKALMIKSNNTENFIPLTAIISIEVKEKE